MTEAAGDSPRSLIILMTRSPAALETSSVMQLPAS